MRRGSNRIAAILFAWIVIVAGRLSAQAKTPYVPQQMHQDDTGFNPQEENLANLEYPAQYESPILYALSYYPDLREVKIIFKEKNIATTLNCKPKITSLFLRKEKRVYIICINKKDNFSGILFREIPVEGQIGIIGHELAHIRDYHSRGIIGIIRRGIAYMHENSKAKFERTIDMMTIQAGLGEYLHRWAYFAVYESNASDKYKRFKRKIYLAPEEIVSIVSE